MMSRRLEETTDAERATHYFEQREGSEEKADWETVESPLPKRKPGRPSRGYTVSYAVRFTREEFRHLDALATAAGITGSELIRRAVAAYARDESPSVPSPTAHTAPRYSAG